jgi:predicted enzyme related to lactoylglutathione lyase
MSRVVHFEFTTPEPEKDVEFFSAVFGWSINRWGEERYWLVDTGEGVGINGAIMPMNSPNQPRTIDTIEIDDLDATMEKALAAGATVAMDVQVMPGVGRVAYFMSPTGILFGAIEPEAQPPAE